MPVRCSLTLLLGLIVVAIGSARDKKDDATAKALSKIAQLGPGVHKIKKDARGRIVSCVIVGQARISTVLGKAKGLEIARTRARLAAAGEFRKWLKEKVSVYESAEGETITLMEGKEEGAKDELKEAGKAVEKTTTQYKTISEGLVRGLQVLHVEVDGENKNYVLVMGWDAATSKATKKVDRDLKDDEKSSGKKTSSSPPKDREPAKPAKTEDKSIKSKSITSDDAKKFID